MPQPLREIVLSPIERLDQSEIVCSGSGKTIPSSLTYCANCGKQLQVKVSQEETTGIQNKGVSEEAWPCSDMTLQALETTALPS
jgi:predicted amidophosphoribosyltransferase